MFAVVGGMLCKSIKPSIIIIIIVVLVALVVVPALLLLLLLLPVKIIGFSPVLRTQAG